MGPDENDSEPDLYNNKLACALFSNLLFVCAAYGLAVLLPGKAPPSGSCNLLCGHYVSLYTLKTSVKKVYYMSNIIIVKDIGIRYTDGYMGV